MAYTKAVRKAVPLMVEVSGVSGCGKSTTALLLAAGMAGGGRVGFLDTENGRGSLLAGEKIIKDALPNGYEIDDLIAPFSPGRYVEKIKEAENAGIKVLIVDSASHEWEGVGGCSEIAEANKIKGRPNWARAKLEHKRFLYHCLSSPMDFIFCFRGRDKTKITESGEYLQLGVRAICEKSWNFDMTVRWHIEELSHEAKLLKAPREIEDRLTVPRMLTVADGVMLRTWKDRGVALAPDEQLQKRARASAEDGVDAYSIFFGGLTKEQKKMLIDTTHAENKELAIKADAERVEDEPQPATEAA